MDRYISTFAVGLTNEDIRKTAKTIMTTFNGSKLFHWFHLSLSLVSFVSFVYVFKFAVNLKLDSSQPKTKLVF